MNGVSVSDLLPNFWFVVNSRFTPLSNVDPLLAFGSIVIALGIALLLPNLFDMTRKYQTVLVNEKQYSVIRIDPLHLSLAYRPSARWSLITGLVAAVAIICLQKTSEFLYFQF